MMEREAACYVTSSIYSPKCLSSRLYLTTKNRRIYTAAGGFRGMRKVAAEERNKFMIIGIATYCLLLPWVMIGVYFMWNPPTDSGGWSWLCYFALIIAIDMLDDGLGRFICWIKGQT